MSRAVLISIQPKWCELIARGEKTIEVRKTRPKLETPFKVYIYCTKPKTKNPHEILEIHGADGKIRKANGKVIGEFVCDRIDTVMSVCTPCMNYITVNDKMDMFFSDTACLDVDELGLYLGVNKYGYALHISDLVIYDKPKELSEFFKICPSYDKDEWMSNDCIECANPCGNGGKLYLSRPPQSWCYVEEVIA